MKIHTSALNRGTIEQAMRIARRKAPDVIVHILSHHGSRSHRQAFDVALRGYGARHTRRPNTGITGANGSEYAATRDDWGWFFASVFVLDPTATCGPYKGVEDFRQQTKGAYTL